MSGLTNQEAADLLGVHRNTVVNWKRDGTIRTFTREEVLRMRAEMWSQFAPATEMPEQTRRPSRRGCVVEGDVVPANALDKKQGPTDGGC